MNLVSIQVFPQGQNGLGSEELVFGKNLTQLYGPNGTGKTPIVQSIPFCLGYPSTFRNDIYDRCSHVVLKVRIMNHVISIKRVYSRDPDIEVTENNGSKQRFYSESEYTEYLFGVLNIDFPYLVSTNNKAVTPYLSTLLPIFYVDQDEGYSNIYNAPNNFIKDQFSEMVRLLFKLPAKNYFDKKKKRIMAKESLEKLDEMIEVHSRKLESAQKSCENITKNSDEIREEITRLESELEGLKDTGSNQDESINILERVLSKKISKVREIEDSILKLTIRTKSTKNIVHEINTEIETLNLNEEARRVFLSIDEICGMPNCQLFSPSSETYSKNLLYLKDQMKDLERNSAIDETRVSELSLRKKELEEEIQETVKERNDALKNSEVNTLVDAISEIKNLIFDLQNQLGEITALEAIKKSHVELMIAREKAYEHLQSFSSIQSRIPEIQRLKANLRGLYLEWLDEIHTSNISHDITFKDDFVPILGQENIKQLKGSTRSRAILAYHAALIQLIVENEGLGFRFLILDTPKQHETHVHDLDRYMHKLKNLCEVLGVQVVFSTTEYHYSGDKNDIEWAPLYPGEEQNMYFYTG